MGFFTFITINDALFVLLCSVEESWRFKGGSQMLTCYYYHNALPNKTTKYNTVSGCLIFYKNTKLFLPKAQVSLYMWDGNMIALRIT